jgi:hypothetical protein
VPVDVSYRRLALQSVSMRSQRFNGMWLRNVGCRVEDGDWFLVADKLKELETPVTIRNCNLIEFALQAYRTEFSGY